MRTDIVYQLSLVTTDIAGLILCYYFFNGFLEQKVHRRVTLTLFFMIISSLLIISNIVVNQPFILVVIAIAVYTTIVIYCFVGHLFIRIISGVFFVAFGVIIEVITSLIISVGFQKSVIESLESTALYVAGTFVSKLIMLFVIKFILRFLEKRNNTVSIRSWGLMLTIPAVSIFITIEIFHQITTANQKNVYPFFSMMGILYINMLMFGFFERILRSVEENSRYRFANQQLILQQEHYKNIMEGHRTTRGIWHDMRNNLLAINTCIEKQEYEFAKRNIESIQMDLNNSMKDIITGNTVVDAILVNKKGDAEGRGITLDTNIIVPDNMAINSMDLCMILGNALDNAIEACDRIQDKEIVKRVEVLMRFENENLILSVINPLELKTISIKNGRYVSSKERANRQEHGYGIYNIERAVRKNGGNLNINLKNKQFILNVLLPINGQEAE